LDEIFSVYSQRDFVFLDGLDKFGRRNSSKVVPFKARRIFIRLAYRELQLYKHGGEIFGPFPAMAGAYASPSTGQTNY
jgi:hypothetical protein